MIVSEEHRYVFVSVPKAGTHTMYATLTDGFGGRQLDGPYHQKDVPAEYLDFFCFASVRHPFQRAVSIWNSLTQRPNYSPKYLPLIGGDSFLEFARWIAKINPANRPTGKGGVLLLSQAEWLEDVRLDRYLHLETINSDFAKLPFVSDDIVLAKLLARDHQQWDELKCSESHELLRKRYANDFQRFGYSDNY